MARLATVYIMDVLMCVHGNPDTTGLHARRRLIDYGDPKGKNGGEGMTIVEPRIVYRTAGGSVVPPFTLYIGWCCTECSNCEDDNNRELCVCMGDLKKKNEEDVLIILLHSLAFCAQHNIFSGRS